MDFPPSRLRLSNFYHTDGEHHGSTNATNKSYLLSEDPNVFDAALFNLNGLEAQTMDRQHRILLETVYEGLERGGCSLDGIQGTKTSVFVGVMNADYYDIQLRDTETIARYNATGTARSIISNLISYLFDLKGASMTIDTACSSSLVALHQAIGNALAHGGTVVVVPQSVRGDPVATAQLMLQEKVTFMIGTPSEYLMLLQHAGDYLRQYRDWRHACRGGESVTEPLKREFRRLSPYCPNVTDCYGPTETSAATSSNTLDLHRDAANEYSTAGRPIPNSTIYILGGNGELVPPAFVGEVCIGGVGVALGYWNLPDLDKQKFIHDPFASSADRRLGWTRLYKTGDCGRLGPDGGLIFMSRLDGDTQIKLHGLQIDLEEMANTLLQVAAGLLSDTVVSVRGGPEFLVAHAVPARGQKVTNSDLESFKKSLPLPQYMCLAAIVLLDRLPTTPNGKVDWKALQDKPLPTQTDSSFPTETLSAAEGELRLIWQDVLQQVTQTGRIDPRMDFFMAGGNSLLLVKLQVAIKNANGLSIALKDLYRCSTLRRMATLIDDEKKNQPFSETIDWEEETRVSGGLARGQRSREPKTTDLHIALTGLTGFLGVEILKALLVRPSAKSIVLQ
ncbi:putative hybrid PKS/NRPS enzyme [Aspergillus nomiae NRRL 13137]|uniref:Putative hybrid PKS/NRPS enzyme n=1 Tax=Aspergillus nomiae NRRL (strain ATCC 15546 / NRRL 13137 / CBS 260.88 / M93) TaxID=1509407 RepID=A0A0L1J5J1_ASPN3|nr:putative hybrid PKS/NRPS enzyme [Aspergillus nomiae NRRL 13137]KNG87004.1 putative hybrid PKS/NRPS enzyme [Aspergillus nomiae NRRL 13137]